MNDAPIRVAQSAADRRPTSFFHLPDPSPSYWVSLRYLNWMRMLVPVALLASVWAFEPKALLGQMDSFTFQLLVWGYLALSIGFLVALLRKPQRFYLQLLVHIVTDIAFVAALMRLTGSVGNSMGVLMLMPVAGAAILSPLPLALFSAAIATLVLLVNAFFHLLQDSAAVAGLVQAGLTGFACFVTALLMNSLARRLVRQEQLAAQRGQDLQNQLEINKLIIADMPNGVVVMGPDGRVRQCNPAVVDLLGEPAPIALEEGWSRLLEKFQAWRAQPNWTNEVVDFDVPTNRVTVSSLMPHATRRIRARFMAPQSGSRAGRGAHRKTDGRASGDVLVFLEDLGVVEARAQQLKLAAMGRLSASIAHEIRNPLSAVRHASALLGEDSDNPTQRKLTRIIELNTQRINRIVEDVLQLSRREPVQAEPLLLVPFLRQFGPEYMSEQGIPGERLQLRIDLLDTLAIRFEETQLRRVLVNLLSNALRYADEAPGAVCLFCHAGAEKHGVAYVEFGVADNGLGLSAQVRDHMFEPFYTTDARGTGLGLYIARELCLVNQATLNYRQVVELSDLAAEVFCIRAALVS